VCLLLFATVGIVWNHGARFLGEHLICPEDRNKSDAILVENFDPNYLSFERARQLYAAGVAPEVYVPVHSDRNSFRPNNVSEGIAELMARLARLPTMELVTIREEEPITLNAAIQLREVFRRAHIRSITVIAPAFRSRRSWLVYSTIFAAEGIHVRCVPVFGTRTSTTWTNTWHGVQEVSLQFAKLEYYQWWVLW